MLPNAVLGALREVDIVVEGNVGGAQRSSLENGRYSLRRSCSSDFFTRGDDRTPFVLAAVNERSEKLPVLT